MLSIMDSKTHQIFQLGKLQARLAGTVATYTLQDCFKSDEVRSIAINDWVGKPIKIKWTGEMHCLACKRKIKKSFQNGHCFPCTQKLASCDSCIVRPELCHFHLGTCRQEDWGLRHCMQDHVLYLSQTSEVKVGITRAVNVPYRFIEQGAVGALPLIKTTSRRIVGLIEAKLRDEQGMADKTNWRKMLTGGASAEEVNESLRRMQVQTTFLFEEILEEFVEEFGEESVEILENQEIIHIAYPILKYPAKISRSLNLEKEKEGEFTGVLTGIKGQYFLFDQIVWNVRSHSGMQLEIGPAEIGF
jgi:hypothetical protein